MSQKTKRFEVIGVSDDKNFCQCCGRIGLKRVVFIRDLDTDEVKHFGTTCAISPNKGFGVDAEIKEAIKRADQRNKSICFTTHNKYRAAGGKYEQIRGCFLPTDTALYAKIKAEVGAMVMANCG